MTVCNCHRAPAWATAGALQAGGYAWAACSFSAAFALAA